ncbi:hypothetical protein C2S53_003785 [Perilla frutescens var. hirtella]|uniref:F-box domain-containing protein n=1 Tax=Perilla frutescens var. hirtella TaxID=608512 RepID=A0AAD4JKZ0_PERFH|nr:hypothetical protein C2S53_003785 [Perilla frutescens var. hirtella]
MVRGLKPKTRPYSSQSRTNIESLPDELLWEILVRVPADDLHDRARVVCRKWSHIIHSDAFVNSHLHHSSYGIVISAYEPYEPRNRNPIYVSATKQGRIEISNKLSCKWRNTAWGSCNGLVLDYLVKATPCILNPVTKQAFLLPPFDSERVRVRLCLCGIGYSAASMEYKVVQTHLTPSGPRVMHLAILSVGVDNSWRHVEVEHLADYVRGLFYYTPLITEGFMHWTSYSHEKVLTMNVETEIITQTNAPTSIHKYYLSTGRYLTLLIHGGDNLVWEVWEMKPETGEWRMVVQNIKFEGQEFEQCPCKDDDHHFLFPVGWVEYPKVLVFGVERGRSCRYYSFNTRYQGCIFYNVNTREINSPKLPAPSRHYRAFPHRNTLHAMVRLRYG